MKYRILLTGKNRTTINEFFSMEDTFECYTTSLRYEDMYNHLKYLKPQIFVYCMNDEQRESINQMPALKQAFHRDTVFVNVGDTIECEEYTKIAVNVADLIITRPVSASGIKQKLLKYMLEKEKKEEEEKAEREKLKKRRELKKKENEEKIVKLKEKYKKKTDEEKITALGGE